MEEKRTKLTNQEWLDDVYQKLLVKMKAECERIGTMIPYTPKDGKYIDMGSSPVGVGYWTNGFWPGMLWQMYEATGDEAYKTAAKGVGDRLAAVLEDSEAVDHDMGFLFLPSAVADYRKTCLLYTSPSPRDCS